MRITSIIFKTKIFHLKKPKGIILQNYRHIHVFETET